MSLADLAGLLADRLCFYCGDETEPGEVLVAVPGQLHWRAHIECAAQNPPRDCRRYTWVLP